MNNNKVFSTQQIGALITMSTLAVWGVWVSWLHITRPMGIDFIEIQFLSAMIPIYLILVPFYVLRVRWSYISGIIVLLGLFVGLTKSVIDHTFFFSLSPYNLTMLAVLIISLAGIYFSLRSYLERPQVGLVKSVLGIGCMLAISAVAVWWIANNQMPVENFFLGRIIQGVQTRTGEIGELDKKIEALMAEGDIPSMAVAIVVDDEIIRQKGYGDQADLDKLFDIGSITKSIVATAVMQLYERGQIDLDDDVNQYLPFGVRHPDYPVVPITIRMLLTNRSCLAHNTPFYYAFSKDPALSQWGGENRGWHYWSDFERLSYPEFMAGYLESDGPYYQPENWANCRPGTKFVYSTPGFDLLGYLVEQVSGQPLNDYLDKNIFTSIKMASATATPLDHPEQMAAPHERWYGVLAKTNVQLPLSQRRIVGGGGLYSTAGDLANFLIVHMNQGRFGEVQLLQPETVALMHQSMSETYGDFLQVGYGYGWSLYQHEPRQMWDIIFRPRGFQGHGGRTWGYSSAMYMVDEKDGAYGYILLMNHSMVESMDQPMYFSVQFNIQDILLGEAYQLYQEVLNE